MMGYASYRVYEQGGFPRQAVPLGIYIAQLVLNFLWTPLFFTAHRLDAAFVVIARERPLGIAPIPSRRPAPT
jgi:tryptophan-rich sensory protein